ncbi:MAG: MFS transporter [Saprospiraceae bacterium]|nr:MFS transporter [Saprospiraceae bacterium]
MKTHNIQPGIRENWRQFALLVLVNAFVGGMVGLERTILPKFAEEQFGIASKTALLSFIVAFGLSKALANYYTGRFANLVGRRNLLLIGWLLAMPIPFMFIHATSWNWIVMANLLLGVSQGLTWSSTVVMKIDLAGEKDRGLAMGLNEFAGYLAVGLVALLTGVVADHYGVTPWPFYMGIFMAFSGFLLTAIWVKDTRIFVQKQSLADHTTPLGNVFLETTFKNRTLSAVTQAGLVNNLNDGMIWGLLPIFLASIEFDLHKIGVITALYPTVWGIGQLFTGKMSDHFPKKTMLVGGMLLQGLAIMALPFTHDFYTLTAISATLGLGTALVYPTFLSTIAQVTSPAQRAESIGVFRLWRDAGYAIGAVISGITADALGIEVAIFLIGALTIGSSLIIQCRMPKMPKYTTVVVAL